MTFSADKYASERLTIFLIGLPGSGKSTLGRALQSAGVADFIDLDQAIEERVGMSVREIFDRQGEAAFRRLETDTLHSLVAGSDTGGRILVVACGGGTPCFGDNLDHMLATGRVVYLQARRDILIRRLLDAGDSRPLLRGRDADGVGRYVDDLTACRHPFYSRANATFDSSQLDTVEQIAATVERFKSFIALL